MPESLETILVVDDAEAELGTVASVLIRAQFRVLEADGASHAIQLANTYAGKIDLLLSDLEMPVMSGPNLGDELKKTRPDVQMMFMSGMDGGDLLVFDRAWTVIEQPLVPVKLPELVTSMLHAPSRSRVANPYTTSPEEMHGKPLMTFRSYGRTSRARKRSSGAGR